MTDTLPPRESPLEDWELLGDEVPAEDTGEEEEESFDPFAEEEASPAFDVEKYNFRQPTARRFQSTASVRANQKKKVFLRVLAQTCCVSKAAEAAGYSSNVPLYRMRQLDPEFAKAWEEAAQVGADVLEREAIRRAVEGVERVKFWKGEEIHREREFSDALLMKLLKAHKPEKFGDNQKIEGEINVNHGVVILPARIRDTSEWEKQAQLYDDQSKMIDVTPENAIEQNLVDKSEPVPQGEKINR